MSHPFTDIVIPVHNALDYTKECVRTVYEHTADFRLILVDDFCDIATREWLYGPECLGRTQENLYIRTGKQKWFTRASNLGLRLVRTPFALLLNTDCVVNDGWLDELYAVREEFEQATSRKVGIVGHVGYENGRRWLEASESNNKGYITGHCWLVSMEALHSIANARGTPGVFLDETRQDAIHINSDRYASYEMNRAGWATVGALKCAVGHHGFKSWGGDLSGVLNLKKADVD